MQFIYKICSALEWAEAAERGNFAGSTVDHADGFIHLSTALQMRETAARHFAGRTGLVLVAFAAADLEYLKWETSRGGILFPHVYGTIPATAARWVKLLPFENASHVFPPEIAG